MGQYICAIDSTWDAPSFGDSWVNTFWGVRVNSVPDMVIKVLSRVKNEKISKLVISGHGQPGMQGVGCGQDFFLGNADKYLWVDMFTDKLCGNGEHFMNLLKPKFEPTAIVSLNGCSTGVGLSGDKLLKRLALILGVKVEAAATQAQSVLPGYEGTVKRCDSNSCSILPAVWSY